MASLARLADRRSAVLLAAAVIFGLLGLFIALYWFLYRSVHAGEVLLKARAELGSQDGAGAAVTEGGHSRPASATAREPRQRGL
ncbi:MAG TPA: hypothetical protein VIE39_10990 [Thermoanaerobaculia bacterium]